MSRISLLLILCASPALAQARGGRQQPPTTPAEPVGRDSARAPARDSQRTPSASDFARLVEQPPVVTHHAIRLNGAELAYTATTGMLPIRNDTTGAVEGGIFYVAYTRDGTNPSTRPLTFVFNGGPGSATVWLHMGAFGPRKVHLNADGTNPPPPYSYEDNPNTLLDQTDLVFLDPVGTGFSRATRPELGPKFWGLDEDVHAVGEFVRLYLTRYERWASPRFLAGESYGTTRAAHLSGYLTDRGIALNGVVLISTVLNFGASAAQPGNDIGYVNFLPSYTATAWYHKKLSADLQKAPIEQVVALSEQFAAGDYAHALYEGERLSAAERQRVAERLAQLTGLSAQFVEQNDLRVSLARFNAELLRDQHLTTGRLDSRFTAYNTDQASERGKFDPSDASIRNSFTPVLSEYVRRELGYRDEDTYYILGGGIGRWHYPQQQGYANVVPSLERAFAKNPDMHLYVAEGYYDMATPYYAVEWTLAHMAIDPRIRAANITRDRFTAGHMVYIDAPSMNRLRSDLRTFLDGAVRRNGAVQAGGPR